MEIKAADVMKLRKMTGAGMMDCKKALIEAEGDFARAQDIIREKGKLIVAKRADRTATEGVVVTKIVGQKAYILCLACETDFVARGDQFQAMAARVAQAVLEHNPADPTALDGVVGDEVKQLIASVGENMQLGKFARHTRQSDNEVIGQYIHANGKIGVLVFLTCGKTESVNAPEVKELAKNLAMQVAAASPMALDAGSLDQAAVEREREVYRQKALEEGKPAQIVDKIADGAVKKFQKEVCLLEQPYIRDDKKSVSDIVREAGKAVGDTITVTGFTRIQLAAE